MITRIVYNNKAFKILNEYGFTNSNNEVTFNDITIDFTGHTLEDMPLKYQEVQIKKCKDNQDILTQGDVLFFGYVETFKLRKMQMSEEYRELEITLLSPRKLATIRTTTIIGTYKLVEALEKIFEPLTNDGYVISEMNVPESQISVSYIIQPVETIMNDLSHKKNLFWTIDEKKNIKISSIDYLFGQNISKIINKTGEGLLNIEPTIENTDYANVINFKNVRLIYSSIDENYQNKTIGRIIKKGDIINFDNPIIVDEKTLRNYIDENPNLNRSAYSFNILLQNNDTADTFVASIYIPLNESHPQYNQYIVYTDGSLTFSDDAGEEGDIVLQRDSFFQNLIIGFKWNRDETVEIMRLNSDTVLRYITMKFLYSAEIEKLKGIISKTGQIEKTIDISEKWFTLLELTNYARNLILENKNKVNSVVLKYDENPRLELGNLVQVNLPDFYIDDLFAVTQIKYYYENDLHKYWEITLKNSDIVSSYIDLFRPTQIQETEAQDNSLVISEFIEEKIDETHIIEEVQDED